MYKSMPKKLREDRNIDALLQDIHAFMHINNITLHPIVLSIKREAQVEIYS